MRNEDRVKRLEGRMHVRRLEEDRAREVIESMLKSTTGDGDDEMVEYALELLRKGSTMAEAIVKTILLECVPPGKCKQR